MKKFLTWLGIVAGGLVAVLILAGLGMMISTNLRFNKQYNINVEPVPIPSDEASLAVGRHWSEMHCQVCHGPDLGGGTVFEEPSLAVVDAPNLTSGQGGVAASYTDEDWIRAIRHGVKKDGTSVFIMASNDFYYLSDQDLGSVIAYVKSVPPVDRETRPPAMAPLGKVLYALGAFGDLLHAETIPHDAPRPASPPAGVTLEYGEYLVNANGCRTCHGEPLSGGKPADPNSPLAPNLTPGGELIAWSEDDFARALREGITPGGHQLNPVFMPWQGLGKMTDDELSAVWLYLQSQPKLQSTTQ